MTNKASDEWIDEYFPTWFKKVQVTFSGQLPTSEHQRQQVLVVPYALFKQAIRQKLQEAQHNCNVADDQPNDVHIKYFNEGYRKGVADMETKLQEVEREAREDERNKCFDNIGGENIKVRAWVAKRKSQLTNTLGKEQK